MSNLPTRPADLTPIASLTDLAAIYTHHVERLADDPHSRAIAALATADALANRALSGRWDLGRIALLGGATVIAVAAATDLTDVEIRFAMVRWANHRRDEGALSVAEHSYLLELLGES